MRIISRLTAVLTAFLSFGTIMQADNNKKNDTQGHVLTREWEKQLAFEKQDLPESRMSVLEDIISKAGAGRLSYDFYDAWRTYCSVRISRNWKEREETEKLFSEAVAAYGEPIVSYIHSRYDGGEYQEDFAEKNAAGLKAASNRAFYTRTGYAQNVLPLWLLSSYVGNDYEFVLWDMLSLETQGRQEGPESIPAFRELQTLYAGTYPVGAFLEYFAAAKTSEREMRSSRLSAVSEKYSGKAVGLLAEGDLLVMKKADLDRSHSDSEEEYVKFHAAASEYERRRTALRGEEKTIAGDRTGIRDIIRDMERKDLGISVKDDTVIVRMKNIASASMKVCPEGSKKPVFRTTVTDSRARAYVWDTVEVVLPKLDDGMYTITAKKGGVSEVVSFERCRLSVAIRDAGGHFGIYVADYKSGRPFSKADITLYKGDTEVISVKDYPLGEGFTEMPSEIVTARAAKAYYTVRCAVKDADGRQMLSRPTYFRVDETYDVDNAPGSYSGVFTDRGAYNPGEKIRFKGIFYSGVMTETLHVYPEGQAVKAVLNDSEGNEIASEELTTNEYGSVAGEFEIPENIRGGMFALRLSCDGNDGWRHVRVDEFKAPSFNVTFLPVEEVYLPGDEIVVRGNAKSYTGHGMTGTRLEYLVLKDSEVFAKGMVVPAADGSFKIGFESDASARWAYYSVQLRAVDGTGETLEFSTGVHVVSSVWMNGNVTEGGSDANFAVSEERDYRVASYVVDGDSFGFMFNVRGGNGRVLPVDVDYRFFDEGGNLLEEGSAVSGHDVFFDSSRGNRFVIEASVSLADDVKDSLRCEIFKVRRDASVLDVPMKYYFSPLSEEVGPGEDITAQFGTSDGPVWAVVELTGLKGEVLERRTVHLEGGLSKDSSLENLHFAYKDEYPDAVRISVFYFKNGSAESMGRGVRRVRRSIELPVAFETFEDRTVPGTEYTFTIRTESGAECLAAVYDKSLDAFGSNEWHTVRLGDFYVQAPVLRYKCGSISVYSSARDLGGAMPFHLRSKTMAAGSAPMYNEAVENEMFIVEDAAEVVEEAAAGDSGDIPEGVAVRSDFATTLAFEPFLRPDADGLISLKFKTSDKLGTYYVALFAHDRDMRNGTVRKEMVVTVPVKVAVTEPGYLYVGDKYSMSVSVSNNTGEDVRGTLYVGEEGGKNRTKSVKVVVPAGGELSRSFEIKVPSGPGEMKVKAVFVADGGVSDGVLVSIPVLDNHQVLTEAHSAILLAGMSEESVLGRLRKEFENVSPFGASYSRISIIDMVREALPSKAEPASYDVVSLTEAVYVRRVAASLGVTLPVVESDDALMERIRSCRNSDGGFAWFEGMDSNPVITALVLERFAKMRVIGDGEPEWIASAVKYLDSMQFSTGRPSWRGGLSEEQYMYVRSMFAGVPFKVAAAAGYEKEFAETMKKFRKFASEYLVPAEERGLVGEIAAKARRLRTLDNLLASDEGMALSKAWGVTGLTRKIAASVTADVASLLEYAVEHPSGGVYYPNLVMPFRGLLESEARDHAMLADLISSHGSDDARCSSVADGIRIWLMVQKETQKWDETPAFVDAIASILAGSEAVKSTSVFVMTKSFSKPSDGVRASGNGFSVERRFFRQTAVAGKPSAGDTAEVRDKMVEEEIEQGTELNVGDRIRAEYRIRNEENRSFVRLTAPREASLKPVNQLSGPYGWGVGPLRVRGYIFRMSGYRDVRSAYTSYYFDSFPEEETVISEDFFVTQAGTFHAPVVEIESLYSPHYRANSGSCAALKVR